MKLLRVMFSRFRWFRRLQRLSPAEAWANQMHLLGMYEAEMGAGSGVTQMHRGVE